MKKWLQAALGIFCLVAADQLSKYWALSDLKSKGPIVLLPGVLELSYVENRGAAFGLLKNQQGLFVLVTAAVLIFLCWVWPRIPQNRRFFPLRLILCMVAAGALGNLIDRLARGYVVDFIYFKLIDFPVFNLADICVTCAAFLLAALLLFYYKEEELDLIIGRKRKDP